MALENFFVESSWILIMSLMALPALAYGGIKLALFCMFTVYFWGAVDMWEVSMQTLALMGLSVILSVIFGVILGWFVFKQLPTLYNYIGIIIKLSLQKLIKINKNFIA